MPGKSFPVIFCESEITRLEQWLRAGSILPQEVCRFVTCIPPVCTNAELWAESMWSIHVAPDGKQGQSNILNRDGRAPERQEFGLIPGQVGG
jgi:hypothetical protein